MHTIKHSFFRPLLFVLLALTGRAQKMTDAERILTSIRKAPALATYTTVPNFRFSSVSPGLSREEIVKAKIRSIYICLDNRWAYTGNDKGCTQYRFDSAGNLLQGIAFDSTGKAKLKLAYTYKYDKRKNPVETRITTLPPAYSILVLSKYDSLERVIFRSVSKQEISRPGQKRKKEAEIVIMEEPDDPGAENNTDSFVENYTYNSLKQLTKYTLHQGNRTTNTSFTYDPLSRVAESKEEYADKVYYKYFPHDMDKVAWGDSMVTGFTERQYTYDKNSGYPVRIRILTNHGSIRTSYFVYDKTGMLLETKDILNDTLTLQYEKYFYDDQGRKIKTEKWSASGLTGSSLYTYVQAGSKGWIQKEMVFSILGYTETYRTFDSKGRMTEENGNYTGHTAGDIKIYRNKFRKTFTYGYLSR